MPSRATPTVPEALEAIDAPRKVVPKGRLRRIWKAICSVAPRQRSAGLEQRRGAMVAMYHSVPAGSGDPRIDPRWAMPAERFRAQMEFLRRHCHPMPFHEATAAIARGDSLPPRAVCVTFDDGYLDNLTVAAPILAELGIPATVFPATGIMAAREAQPIDRLRWLIATADAAMLSIPLPDGEIAAIDLRHLHGRRAAFLRLDAAVTLASRELRRTIFEALREQGGEDLSGDGLTLDPDDLHRLARDHPNIEIGAHGVDHLDLTRLPPEGLAREIRGSISDAQQWAGRAICSFSCPYNRSNERVRSALRDAGIRAATGDGDGSVLAAGGDPLGVPRFNPAAFSWPL